MRHTNIGAGGIMTTYVSITLTYVTSSLAAIAFELPEEPGVFWLPKSQIRNLEVFNATKYSNGDKIELEIPEWLAREKSLDPYCKEINVEESR